MKDRGILFVVSGFAGTGKSTVARSLVNSYDNYALSISVTTRLPRDGEVEGVDYFFKTKDEFELMIGTGELLEFANYVGNYYGTPKSFVESELEKGKDVILEIEPQGAIQVKSMLPEALLIFILPPTIDELYNRIRTRASDSEDQIKSRLERARKEAGYIFKYDNFIINDDVEKAVNLLHNIVQCEKSKVVRNTEKISAITADL